MLRYAVATSGSCGNCYVFYDGANSIVVDYGISTKRFTAFLDKNGIPLESVRAVFLTHLHPDHASNSLRVLQKRIPVLVYMNSCAAKREHSAFVSLGLDVGNVRLFAVGEKISIGGFEVVATDASHDSEGCVSYHIRSGENRICVITDTGYFTNEMMAFADASDLLMLEADYDDAMLDENDEYSYALKMRIRSDFGHLSNDQARRFLLKLGKNENRGVLLIHLSENNNTVERAQWHVREALPLNKFIRAIAHGGSLSGEL